MSQSSDLASELITTTMIIYVFDRLEKTLISLLEVSVRKESTEMGRSGISVPQPAENTVRRNVNTTMQRTTFKGRQEAGTP